MSALRRAVIDVGTNSVKVLVADVAGREVSPVWEESRQTRLGRGFYKTHELRPEAVSATAEAVAAFVAKAREHGAESVRIIATSAARDARNAPELERAIGKACGLAVQIISGKQEAVWAFEGVTTDPRWSGRPLLLLEVGGGSCQFIVGHAGSVPSSESFALGTVRLMESIPHQDPPLPEELEQCRTYVEGFLREEVRPRISPLLEREVAAAGRSPAFIGSGGSASVLGCMEAQLTRFDRERLEAVSLEEAALGRRVESLWAMPLEQRRQIPGLPPNRADVILTGALIYHTVMRHFGLGKLELSTRGLRFGALIC